MRYVANVPHVDGLLWCVLQEDVAACGLGGIILGGVRQVERHGEEGGTERALTRLYLGRNGCGHGNRLSWNKCQNYEA